MVLSPNDLLCPESAESVPQRHDGRIELAHAGTSAPDSNRDVQFDGFESLSQDEAYVPVIPREAMAHASVELESGVAARLRKTRAEDGMRPSRRLA
jgi:hypothetical protein